MNWLNGLILVILIVVGSVFVKSVFADNKETPKKDVCIEQYDAGYRQAVIDMGKHPEAFQ